MQHIAVFRADATPALGGGHVMRCMAVARALKTAGWRCVFASVPGTADVVPWVRDFEHIELSDTRDHVDQMREAWPAPWSFAMTDSYDISATTEARIRPLAETLLVVDDLHNRRHDCDYLLNQTLGCEPESYEPWVNSDCRFLLGPEFALLRPDFSRYRARSIRRRATSGGVIHRVFVSFGATDFPNLAARALHALNDVGPEIEVDVALASGAPHLNEIRRIADKAGGRIHVHVDCSNVAEILAKADFAFGAPGITSWERCTLGIPSILVPWAENQRDNANILAKTGAAEIIGWEPDVSSKDISDALSRFMNAPERVVSMSNIASGCCDGRGIQRVIMATIPRQRSKTGQKVSLRFASASDGERLFDWQATEGVRRFFRNPAKPTSDEHGEWLTACLADPDRFLCIIEAEEEPVGMLRLDAVDKGTRTEAEISVLVEPKYGNAGIASAALRTARDVWPDWDLHADVHPQNIPSHALFLTCGFRLEADGLYWSRAN